MIKIGSGLSTKPDSESALTEAAELALLPLGGTGPDLCFFFFSPHHTSRMRSSVEVALKRLDGATVLGVSAQAVIGENREVEQGPAISVWAATMPNVDVVPFTLNMQYTPDGQSIIGLPQLDEQVRALFVLADPHSFPVFGLLSSVNRDNPGLPVIGGQASGGGPGENLLFINGEFHPSGAVGVAVSGDIKVSPVVSQGCKPFGNPLVVTAGERNMIYNIGGMPALMRLRQAADKLPEEEKTTLLQNLQVGLAIDERKTPLERGDFLMRGLMQADMESGAIAIADSIEVGQTVQFQLRDAVAADEDLKSLLTTGLGRTKDKPAGALLFTCNGRGTGLFGTPDHDVRVLKELAGNLPVAGMFCQGEIGPIGGKNFLHGFTASIALIQD